MVKITEVGRGSQVIRERAPLGQKRLYVIAEARGLIKIGVSNRPYQRFQTLEQAARSQGALLQIERIAVSEFLSGFAILEREIHDNLNASRCYGEWFDADFDEVCALIRHVDGPPRSSIDPQVYRKEEWVLKRSDQRTGERTLGQKLSLIEECSATFGTQAAAQLWFQLGLPIVPAMLEHPRQLNLFSIEQIKHAGSSV